MPNQDYAALGQQFVTLFNFRPVRGSKKAHGEHRYHLQGWGDYTLTGVGKVAERLVKEAKIL